MLSFFDCNCMLGRMAGVRLPFHTRGELVKELKYYNISRAMVYHSPYGPGCDNELLLAALKGARSLYPVALAIPWETSRQRLTARTREILEQTACAVRLFPVADGFDFSASYLKEIMAIVARRRLPVMVDADQVGGFGALEGMLKGYPKVPFILCRAGCGRNRYVYDLLERYSNFYVETSLFRAFDGLEDVAATFGAGRILFGSGLPVLDAGAAVTRVIYAGLSPLDKQKIAFGNLERLLAAIR